jgi:fibronectin-binding autotransporter adhesin
MQRSFANELAGAGNQMKSARRTRIGDRAVFGASRRLGMLAAALAATGAVSQALGANGADTWVGNSSALWSTGGWTGANNPPISGDSLVFGAAGSAGATLTDDVTTGSSFNITNITFSSGAAAYTIAPSSSLDGFTLVSTSTTTGGIAISSTNAQSIGDAITFSNVATTSSALNTLNAVAATAGSLTLSGNLSTASGLNQGVNFSSGAGSAVYLTGTDSFVCSAGNALVVSAGTVNDSGNVTVTCGGAALVIDANGTLNITGGLTQMTGSGSTAIGVNSGTGTLSVSGGTFEQVSGSLAVCNSGSNSAVGVLTISGTGKVIVDSTAGIVFRVSSTSGHGVINLNGGEFDTAVPFTTSASTKTGNIVSFNGGTLKLKATPSGTTLVNNPTDFTFNVGNGGAIFDVNGFTTNVNVGLVNSGTGGLTLSSSLGNGSTIGTLILSASNTYTGTTTINSGTLQIGAGSTAGTLGTGGVTDNGTLAFDRSDSLTVGSAIGGNGAVTQIGGGTTILTASNNYSGATTISSGTLQLGDGTSGHDGTINNSLTISNSGTLTFSPFGTPTYAGAITGSGGVNKSGAGTQTLSGSSNYNGATNITAGTLNVTGSLGNTTVTVGASGTLTGAGTTSTTGILGGSVIVNGTLAVSGPSSQALTINALTFNGGSFLSATASGGTVEPVNVGTFGSPTGSLTVNGSVTVPITGITATGTYTLMQFGSQSGAGQFLFSNAQTTMTVGRNMYSLSDYANSLVVSLNGPSPLGVAYFNNGAGTNIWNDLSHTNVNFSSDAAGTVDAGNVPGPTTDVILTASNLAGTAVASTLGASTTINSLTVNSSAASNTINPDGSTLTINALADGNGNTASNGISVNSGSGPFTINIPVVLGGNGVNQTWTNASGSTFTVTNTISGNAGGQTLSLVSTGAGNTLISGTIIDGGGSVGVTVNDSGSGMTVFTGTNTYSGTTTISAGTLELGDGTSGHDGTIAGASIVDNGTLLLNRNGSSAYAGAISGSGAVTKSGSGSQTLSGSSSYTGLTTVNQGTLTAASDSALGSSTAATAGLVLSPAMSSTVTVNFTSATPAIASLSNPGAGTSAIVLGNTAGNSGAGTPTTLSMGGNNASTTYSGTISDGTVGGTVSTAAIGNITKLGTGTLTLSAANSYIGNTNINAGTVIMANPMALGAPKGGPLNDDTKTIVVFPSNGGTLDVQTPGDGATPDGLYSMQENSNGTGTVLSDVPAPGNGVNHTFGTLRFGSNTILNIKAGPNVTGGNPSFTFNSLLVFNSNTTSTLIPTINLNIGTVGQQGTVTGHTIDLDGTSSNNTITGTISGGLNISKTNTSIWTLSVSNGYTGTTTIANGILAMQDPLAFGQSEPVPFPPNVTMTGGEIGIPADSYIADSSFDLTNYAVNYGTNFANGVGIAFENYASALAFPNIPTIRLGALAGTPSSLSGDITGNTLLTYTGPGSLTVTGQVQTSQLIVQAGMLTLSGINASPSPTNTTVGNLAGSSATLVLANGVQMTSGTLSIANVGNGTVSISDGNTLTVTGTSFNIGQASGVAGNLTMTGGTFTDTAATSAHPLFVANSGAAGTTGAITLSGDAAFSAPNATLVLGQFGSTASATNASTATLTMSGTSTVTVGNTVLGGANAASYVNGIVNLNGGTLSTGSITKGSTNLASSATQIVLNANGGTLKAVASANNSNFLNGIFVNIAAGGLTLDTNGNAVGVTNSMSGAGGLTKIGSGTLTLSGSNSYSGSTAVSNGTLEVGPAGSLPSGNNVTVDATTTPAAVKIDARTATGIQIVTLGTVNLIAGGTLTAASVASPGSVANHPNRMVLVANTLSNAGNIDLGGNDLIVHNGSLSSINGQVAAGFNGPGYWNGSSNGSILSSAAASDSTFLTSLGVATGLTSFDGMTVSSTDVLVKYTYYGDADLSGTIDGGDYSIIDANNGTTSGATWSTGDFNYDGRVDGSDYSLIDNAFNMQGSGGLATPMNMVATNTAEVVGGSAVPEPGTVSILGIAAAALLGRRRRKWSQ